MEIKLPDDMPTLTGPQMDTAAQALRKQWVTWAIDCGNVDGRPIYGVGYRGQS